MAAKSKYTREKMVEEALAIVSKDGCDALTARALANRLGCSTRPIFTAFDDMDDLKREVRAYALRKVDELTWWAAETYRTFPEAEMQVIHLFANEPNLFQLVFMSGEDHLTDFERERLGTKMSPEVYTRFMRKTYDLDEVQATKLFRHAWVYAYGIGALCATGRHFFTDDEMRQLLEEDFAAMYAYVRSSDAEEEVTASVA